LFVFGVMPDLLWLRLNVLIGANILPGISLENQILVVELEDKNSEFSLRMQISTI